MSPSQPSFCTPGSPARNLSVTSLPRPALRNAAPGIASVSLRRSVVPSAANQASSNVAIAASWILPRLWSRPRDLEPLGIGRHHPPRDEVVERRPPQHRLLAAGVHRDVAADARRVGRRRVDGEDESRRFRRLHHALRHDAGAAVDRRDRRSVRAERERARPPRGASSFSVLMTAARGVERNRAARVAGAAAARDDREPELDAALDERAHLVLGVGVQHDERILDAPVGGIGHVRHAREAVERDVVRLRRARAARARVFARSAAVSRNELRSASTAARAAATSSATLRSRSESASPRARAFSSAPLLDLVAADGASRRPAARGASGCR